LHDQSWVTREVDRCGDVTIADLLLAQWITLMR